jgi:Uma2 family endonuclease
VDDKSGEITFKKVDKELIGDMVKILLDRLNLDCECFGSTTLKRQDMASDIEPDQCFYIQNHQAILGKRRINLSVDPSPDLAITFFFRQYRYLWQDQRVD